MTWKHPCSSVTKKVKVTLQLMLRWHGSGARRMSFSIISSFQGSSMQHIVTTLLPNWSPPFNVKNQGSWVEVFYSWTIMQDPTQQGTQTNIFIAWGVRDWITWPAASFLSHFTFFLHMNQHYRNVTSDAMKNVQQTMKNFLTSLDDHRFYHKHFLKLISRYDKCIK